MAIQHRRGVYADFVPSKLLPAEVAVVLSGDTSTVDGAAVYIAITPSIVKKIVTDDNAEALFEQIVSHYELALTSVDDGNGNVIINVENTEES